MPEQLEPLATIEDLEARMGRRITDDETPRAEALLQDASAAVRAYTGQQFTAGTTTARLRPRNGTVRLPQRPVVDVTAVANVEGTDVAFTWDTGDQVAITGLGSTVPFDVEPIRRVAYLDVTYEHGYELIPDDIIAVVCQIAGRAFGRPVQDSGTQQESIGGYSYSVGVAAAAGGVGMLNDERAVLDRYRIPVASGRFG